MDISKHNLIAASDVAKGPARPAKQDQTFSKIMFFRIAKNDLFLLKRKFPILSNACYLFQLSPVVSPDLFGKHSLAYGVWMFFAMRHAILLGF